MGMSQDGTTLNFGGFWWEFACRKILSFTSVMWLCLTTTVLFLFLFLFLFSLLSKFSQRNKKGGSNDQEQIGASLLKEELNPLKGLIEVDLFDDLVGSYQVEDEEESSNFAFKFESSEEYMRNQKECESCICEDGVDKTTTISNYSFLSDKGFSGFISAPEDVSYSVVDAYVHDFENVITGVTESETYGFGEVVTSDTEDVMMVISSGSNDLTESQPDMFRLNKHSGTEFEMDPDVCILSDKNLAIGDCYLSEQTSAVDVLDSGSVGANDESCLLNGLAKDASSVYGLSCELEIRLPDGVNLEDNIVELPSGEEAHEEYLTEKSGDSAADSPDPMQDSSGPRCPITGSDNFEELNKPTKETTRLSAELVMPDVSCEDIGFYGEVFSVDASNSNSVEVLLGRTNCSPESGLDLSEGAAQPIQDIEMLNLSDLNNESLKMVNDEISLFGEKQYSEDCSGDTFSIINFPPEMEDSERDNRERIFSEKSESEKESKEDLIDCHAKQKEGENDKLNKNSDLGKASDLAKEDFNEFDCLKEHHDLIEQLDVELKKVRISGLPTIDEECELTETLKARKFNVIPLHGHPMSELQKFYNKYRERMRKFDVLSQQKLYATDFLKPKSSFQSTSFKRRAVISLLGQSLLPYRWNRLDNSCSETFAKEIQSDLETAYVAQTCLSWEFLWWQYEKCQRPSNSSLYGSAQYNRVAVQFQQFQVLIQRFLEDEPFQVARVPNYINNRRANRHFLQVPVIKEDGLKDKMCEIQKGNNPIRIEELNIIMERSIRLFWQFVKPNMVETTSIIKSLIQRKPELQNPKDYHLMVEIQAHFQKKQKKLKDMVRAGNCVVKKFMKPEEDRSNQDLFFSQVDLKLLSRVLDMSRITTDQLLWCHNKLGKISFVERKIHREPSFLLFPF